MKYTNIKEIKNILDLLRYWRLGTILIRYVLVNRHITSHADVYMCIYTELNTDLERIVCSIRGIDYEVR